MTMAGTAPACIGGGGELEVPGKREEGQSANDAIDVDGDAGRHSGSHEGDGDDGDGPGGAERHVEDGGGNSGRHRPVGKISYEENCDFENWFGCQNRASSLLDRSFERYGHHHEHRFRHPLSEAAW